MELEASTAVFTESLCYLLTLTLTEYIGNRTEYDLCEMSFRDMGNRKILEIKRGKPDLPAMFLLQLVKELAHIVICEKNGSIKQEPEDRGKYVVLIFTNIQQSLKELVTIQ